MNNIVTAAVRITGTRPLWFHRFGPDAMPLEKQERTGVAGNDPEEWKRTVLALPGTGQLYIQDTYVFGAVRDGARYTKKGRGSIQTVVAATLQVTESVIPIDGRFLPGGLETPPPTDPTAPVYLDIRGVRNPATKGRNVRYRVACPAGWQCGFTLQWDKTVVNRQTLEAVMIDTGKLIGLGNGRSIGMGRFDIQSFDVAENR